jgi:hypothetical protein
MTSWQEIEDFPDYHVSDEGEVYNAKTKRILTQNRNQQGMPYVGLIFDGKQYKRAVGQLVARSFLPAPPFDHFDTVINLDGDRMNNVVENLMWRPRWFAIAYHQQFYPGFSWGFVNPIVLVEEDERFENSREACIYYGLLANDIFASVIEGKSVFPLDVHFRLEEPKLGDRY